MVEQKIGEYGEPRIGKCNMTKEELASLFFRLRFSKDPASDPGYLEEWKHRFEIGSVETFMDGQSRAIYEVIKKACDFR